jgi:hypothetical protein
MARIVQGDNNNSGSDNQYILGNNNTNSGTGILVGDNNQIGYNTDNIHLFGSNHLVTDNSNNIFMVGSNNQIGATASATYSTNLSSSNITLFGSNHNILSTRCFVFGNGSVVNQPNTFIVGDNVTTNQSNLFHIGMTNFNVNSSVINYPNLTTVNKNANVVTTATSSNYYSTEFLTVATFSSGTHSNYLWKINMEGMKAGLYTVDMNINGIKSTDKTLYVSASYKTIFTFNPIVVAPNGVDLSDVYDATMSPFTGVGIDKDIELKSIGGYSLRLILFGNTGNFPSYDTTWSCLTKITSVTI